MEHKDRLLLQKFLLGQCTDEEQKTVHTLLEQENARNPLDEMIREQSAAEWENPPATDAGMQDKLNRRLKEMQLRITAEAMPHIPLENNTPKPFLRKPFVRYAAACVIAILAAATVLMIRNNNHSSVTTIAWLEQTNAHGKPVRYRLPDSSTVYLAAGSKLRYPKQFVDGERIIQLDGEAFFDIMPDVQQPFIVHTATARTRVLGTSFKISAFPGTLLEVAVATGKVAVDAHAATGNKELAVLTPGWQLSFNSQTGETSKSNVDIAGLTQWTAGELMFNEQPLGSVAQALERRYQVQVQFADEKMKRYKVSGTFAADEPVSSVLDMLGFVGKFRYKETKSNHTTQLTIYPSK
jgi:ferric-dicitrate binding protein FerR (iron transport regulator)